jgi:hypothetical protein
MPGAECPARCLRPGTCLSLEGFKWTEREEERRGIEIGR